MFHFSFYIFILGIILVAFLSYKLRLLTLSGSVMAIVIAIFIYLGFQWKGLVLLGIFFITSSFWSVLKKKEKELVEERLEKSSRRDWQQVFANGGVAALCSVLYYWTKDPNYYILFAIALATSNSDTWASEIGTLSKVKPLSIKTWKRVPKGTSGAISGLGTMAALLGSLLMGIISYSLFQLPTFLFLFVFLFGFFGNVIDTFLGAYVQAVYQCPICHMETEKRYHCKRETTLIQGWDFLDNDGVNFLSSLIAVFIAHICLFII